MLIPDRKPALLKMRDTVAEMLADGTASDKLRNQTTWLVATLNQLLQVEDRDWYLQHYLHGRALIAEGNTWLEDGSITAALAALPAGHEHDHDMGRIRASMAAVLQLLTRITSMSLSRRDAATSRYLDRVIDWENALYLRLDPPAAPPSPASPLTRESLETYLRQRATGCDDLAVTALKPLYGGFSKQTTLFSTRDSSRGEQHLVMRAEKKAKLVFLGGTDIAREYHLVRYLHRAGLPVAEPLWMEDDADRFGTRFMVSRQVRGNIVGVGTSDMRSLPAITQRSLIETLARIHQTPVDAADEDIRQSHLPDWIAQPDLQTNTRAWVLYWKQQMDRAGCPSTPLVERACGWLLDNVPREEIRPGIIHGDFGLGNVLIADGRVDTVLDWELSFFGDPAYDFTNFMLEYDRSLLDVYEAAGGEHISEYRFFYYQVFRVIKSIPEIIGLNQLDVDPHAHLNFHLLSGYIHLMSTPLNALLARAASLTGQNRTTR